MKLSIHVMAVVAMVWGHGCDVDVTDVTSHLAIKATTAVAQVTGTSKQATPLISEFQPYLPPSRDRSRGDPQPLEISGPPSTDFLGCIWTIQATGGSGMEGEVLDALTVSGTFDANGLLVVDVFDLDDPEPWSGTVVLSASCPNITRKDNILDPSEAQGIIDDAETIYDSIGVPGFSFDERNLEDIRTVLESFGVPGIDLTYNGDQVHLVFRDASVGEVYSANFLGSGPAMFDARGNELIADDFDSDPFETTFGAINPTRGSSVVGDPHIHTFKGDQYTLLREGSFLLWHFGLKQPQVEWQIFAHYSGRQSFTKGLLLVDTSGPQPSTMEITSEQCDWQALSGNSKEWLSISDGAVLSTGASSQLKLVGDKTNMKQVQFFVADEKAPVATLKVVCRPGRHINVKLHMANQKWQHFVSGQLKGTSQSPSSKEASMLQRATKEDQEFETKKTWEELGGSPHGQQYLKSFDSQTLGLLQKCDDQAEAEARAICHKHLGDKDSAYFQECVFDVCAGAGEAGAEMAAEILKF